MNEIHRLGLIHGDVRLPNIIIRTDGRYVLIDYGRTFSENWNQSGLFPPMKYLIDETNDIPTKQDDFNELRRILS